MSVGLFFHICVRTQHLSGSIFSMCFSYREKSMYVDELSHGRRRINTEEKNYKQSSVKISFNFFLRASFIALTGFTTLFARLRKTCLRLRQREESAAKAEKLQKLFCRVNYSRSLLHKLKHQQQANTTNWLKTLINSKQKLLRLSFRRWERYNVPQ